MEKFLFTVIGGASGAVSYGIVFGVLMACGLGLPLPEDISLILGGFLAYQGRADLIWMMVTGYVGIIGGDSLVFYLGRRIGSKMGTAPGGFLRRIVTPQKRARVEGLFKKHGEKIVMLARFLPGVRSVTYFTAGSVGMPYSHFLFFDSVAALASAPLFVYLGYRFGGELETLLSYLRSGQRTAMVALVVLIVAGVVFARWKSKREARLNAEALAKAQAITSLATASEPENQRPQSLRESGDTW